MHSKETGIDVLMADSAKYVDKALDSASPDNPVLPTLLVWISRDSSPAAIHFPNDTLLDPNPLVTIVAASVNLLNPFACALVHPILTFPGGKPKGVIYVVIEKGGSHLKYRFDLDGTDRDANPPKEHHWRPTTLLRSVDTSNLSADDQVRAANIATLLKVQSMQALTFAAPSAGRENAPGAIH